MTFNVHRNGQAEAVPDMDAIERALGRAVLMAMAMRSQPTALTYESTRNLECLPGELSPNGWHKEA